MSWLPAYQSHWLHQPYEVSLETQSLCNAACTFCPYPTLERIGQKMPDELIDKLFAEMAQWKAPFYLSLFKVNEPLLDKRVMPLYRRANRELNARIRIFTNGQALTPDKVQDIAGLKRVEHLWISLNEYRPEEYRALMGLDFDKTAKRLDYLHAQDDFPHKVVLSCVGWPNEEFRRYCFDRWPRFDCFAIKKDAWISFTDPQVTEIPDTPCSRWFELSIMSNGIVSHCCMDSDGSYAIGDVTKQTMLEVYNSPFWAERRERGLSRKQLDERSPCAACTY